MDDEFSCRFHAARSEWRRGLDEEWRRMAFAADSADAGGDCHRPGTLWFCDDGDAAFVLPGDYGFPAALEPGGAAWRLVAAGGVSLLPGRGCLSVSSR
ncbi:hypothetical protein SDC9_162481 [bioreactor metagenome]|uniref:Uncharacterized protein n=1 Tax=bioreactor metagenome TaxID=1076179 RepID=A0A645FNJ8_9ZZZZ